MAGRSPVAFARRFWEKVDKRRPDECPGPPEPYRVSLFVGRLSLASSRVALPAPRISGRALVPFLGHVDVRILGLEQAAMRANAAVYAAVEDVNGVARSRTYEYPIT